MFAITTLIRKPDGTSTVHEGSLVKLPPELIDVPRLRKYELIKSQGWGVSEFGYSYFAKAAPEGDLFVFPGLIIEGAPKPQKKFAGYRQTFRKGDIETFADDIISFHEETRARTQADLNMLIHDLRSLSNTIYNAAEEAQTFVNARNWSDTNVRIENVIAAQAILRIRTDALDFVGNTSAVMNDTNVPIFKKVDKVSRCLRPRAFEGKIGIRLHGLSFKSSRGPDVFEIVPYALIDNAVKYSPKGLEVDVEVHDLQNSIQIRVTSVGPRITESEKQRIFEKGFRGQYAMNSGKPGSGLGLHLASRIVRQHFKGDIMVKQGNQVHLVDNVDLFETEFLVILPSA